MREREKQFNAYYQFIWKAWLGGVRRPLACVTSKSWQHRFLLYPRVHRLIAQRQHDCVQPIESQLSNCLITQQNYTMHSSIRTFDISPRYLIIPNSIASWILAFGFCRKILTRKTIQKNSVTLISQYNDHEYGLLVIYSYIQQEYCLGIELYSRHTIIFYTVLIRVCMNVYICICTYRLQEIWVLSSFTNVFAALMIFHIAWFFFWTEVKLVDILKKFSMI